MTTATTIMVEVVVAKTHSVSMNCFTIGSKMTRQSSKQATIYHCWRGKCVCWVIVQPEEQDDRSVREEVPMTTTMVVVVAVAVATTGINGVFYNRLEVEAASQQFTIVGEDQV
jgi:hypothetical protein